MGRREFVGLISMLMALTAFAIDMMLPAFGAMRTSFGLEAGSTALAPVVTVFFLGFGLGQPVWGSLSDVLGRKRIIWLGLSIFALAAVGAAMSPSLGLLLGWRFVSGLGAAAVRVATLGTVRDRYRGEEMARVMSYVMAVFVLVPVVAPTLGAALLLAGSWQWVFGSVAVAAMAAAAWVLRLPESLPAELRIPLDPRRLLSAARAVVSSRFAMGFTIAQMAAFGFLASYLGSAELIVRDVFGLGDWFPLIFAGVAVASGAAFVANPRLLDRVGLRQMVRMSPVAFLAAALLFATVAIIGAGHPPFFLYLAAMLPLVAAFGFVIPNVNSAAMMPMSRIAGTAAAVIGAVATLGGALIGAVVDAAYDGSLTPFAVAWVAIAVVALLASRWSDAAWDREADLELLSHEAQAQATAAAPIEVG